MASHFLKLIYYYFLNANIVSTNYRAEYNIFTFSISLYLNITERGRTKRKERSFPEYLASARPFDLGVSQMPLKGGVRQTHPQARMSQGSEESSHWCGSHGWGVSELGSEP